MRPYQRITLVLALCLGALAGPFAAIASMPAQGDGPVLVVAPFGQVALARHAVDAAGGDLIGPERALIAVMAYSRDEGFAEKLKESGTWLVLDARAIAQVCGVRIDELG